MRRVIFNQKGGVGKSSITCNLAAICAKSGAKTLVIDLDPQANSTHYLLGRGPNLKKRSQTTLLKPFLLTSLLRSLASLLPQHPTKTFLLLQLMLNWIALSKNWNHGIKFINLEIY